MKQQISKYLLSIIGIILFSYYIWGRFIRERLPRDIPFELTLTGFIVLLYICWIYGFVFISNFYTYKFDPGYLIKIINAIYKPLITLDESIKTNSYIKPYYEKLLIYLVYKGKNINEFYNSNRKFDYIYLVYIFQIFPRMILVTVLLIDTFYFHQLYFLYKCIPLFILIFLYQYVLYSFKYAKEQFIVQLESMAESIVSDYPDPNDEYPGEYMSYLNVNRFIDEQTFSIVFNNKAFTFHMRSTNEYKEDFCKRHCLPSTHQFTSEEIDLIHAKFFYIMEIVIPLSVHIDEYEVRNSYTEIKRMKTVIYGMYFICWSYILIKSFLIIPKDSLMIIIDIITHIEEPFSQLPI